MLFQKKKNFLLCYTFFMLVAFVILIFPYVTHALEVSYPHIPGFGGPNDTLNSIFAAGNLSLGDVFQFLFVLALWIVGLLVFGSLLVFGFIWETSGANPSKKLAAKMHFQGTLIGVAILLGFTIILRTINPDLATLANKTFKFCGNNSCSSIAVNGPVTVTELNYTINYRDAGVAPTTALSYTKAFEENVPAYNSLQNCADIPNCDATKPDPFTRDFFNKHVDDVVQEAINHNSGVNPVFVVAVWLQGTIMSSGKNPFACDDPTKSKSFDDSKGCFYWYIDHYGQDGSPAGFEKWISNYCRASLAKTICGNPPYAPFIQGLQNNYDAFFRPGDNNASQKLDPPISQPVP